MTSTPAQEIFQVHFPPDTTFALTSTMLQHDAPSMLSRVFLSSNTFIENTSKKITITDKSPDLFAFILDYLRGYTIFPLKESAVPPRWLPLDKTYENIRRDASYYGFLRLEAECKKWLRRLVNPTDRQAVLKLDFAPFTPITTTSHNGSTSHPLIAEMMLECHLADVSLLRKRFLKAGARNLTYGPMPWKHIFEQIRNPTDRDGVLQLDGSSFVELAPLYLKQPRSTDDTDDIRKIEWAKIHISKGITALILDGMRPAGMHSYITVRFHATDVTTSLTFQKFTSSPFPGTILPGMSLCGTARFTFNDKLQRDGYIALRGIARSEGPDDTRKEKDECIFIPLETDNKTVFEVDDTEIYWSTLTEWGAVRREGNPRKESWEVGEIARCERLFGSGVVRLEEGWKATASIHGSAVFILARTRFEHFVLPQLVNVRGISERTWEHKRPIWEGDCERERNPRKKAKTKADGEAEVDDSRDESVEMASTTF